MNKVLKYTLLGICGGLLVACITAAFIAGIFDRKDITCSRLVVQIADSTQNRFVTTAEIRKCLRHQYGNYIGTAIDSIDIRKVEEIVDAMSAVQKSQAYVTKDGTLHIDITQRKPVVRLQNGNKGFYADREGYIFPLQKTFSSHVHIVEGEIPINIDSGHQGEITDPGQRDWLLKIVELVCYIEENKEWEEKVVQIHVSKGGDLVLIPREGKERFLFGQPENISDKFDKIKKYYTAIIPEKGKEAYRSVDVRYKGQIICK